MPKRNNERTAAPAARSPHHARSVGQDQWVISYLPGRTLSRDQARAALRVAEELHTLRSCAAELGLTVIELVGLAMMDCSEQRTFLHTTAAQTLSQLRQAQ